jgi:tetratricopeptide (TPR) repeat protein
MNKKGQRNRSLVPQLTEEIIGLIFDGHLSEAEEKIASARAILPADESHRLTALSAVLQREVGNLHESIALMQRAAEERPNWLPHLFRLSVFLMDAERWAEANVTLDELISLSESKDEAYFLDDARIRKIMCLKRLGRTAEIPQQKAKIAPGTSVYIGDRSYNVDDVE